MGSMSPTSPTPLLLVLVVVASGLAGVSALNITRLLDPTPEFATFSQFLNKTGVAAEVNHRQTITILALDNGAMGAISGLDESVAADVLRIHVILDYYDLDKLHSMRKHTTILTTLLQSTGHAANMGFLNVTIPSGGHDILMGSSAPHEPLSARVVKMVLTRPYNISILKLDSAIIPQGLFAHPMPPPPPPPPPSPPKALVSTPTEPPKGNAEDDDAPASAPVEEDDAATPVADASTSPSPLSEGPTASMEDGEDDAMLITKDDGSAGWRVVAGGRMVGTAMMAVLVALL